MAATKAGASAGPISYSIWTMHRPLLDRGLDRRQRLLPLRRLQVGRRAGMSGCRQCSATLASSMPPASR